MLLVEKDIELVIFLECMSKIITVLMKDSQAKSNNLKALESSKDRNNLHINSFLSGLVNLTERVDSFEKTNTK